LSIIRRCIIAEEKKNDSTNEGELTKEDKFVEEMKSDPDDNREVEPLVIYFCWLTLCLLLVDILRFFSKSCFLRINILSTTNISFRKQ
jgi:hypothetical protein